jgi:hypothetical protein
MLAKHAQWGLTVALRWLTAAAKTLVGCQGTCCKAGVVPAIQLPFQEAGRFSSVGRAPDL